MSSDAVIRLNNLGKCYQIYDKPRDRLLQIFMRGRRRYFREFWALRDLDLSIKAGEVVGVIGSNGAGKSTLLQLVCGTLTPTQGEISVRGRVAALLELGAGFNPEFSGRENVFLSATVAGMSHAEISERYDEIVEFSGIHDFIDQPVKTYSSGMYVRLAFSVAINVDPDILVIDEALSVGDGEFSRKSFDRMMDMKNAGKTILFCSHALYQVEAICDSAIWLKDGRIISQGKPAKVVMAYNDSLNVAKSKQPLSFRAPEETAGQHVITAKGTARLSSIDVSIDKQTAKNFKITTGVADFRVKVAFDCNLSLPMPHVGICFIRQDGQIVASVGTHFEHRQPTATERGGKVDLIFPQLPLLKGAYQLDVYLMCENGVHVYDCVNMAALIEIEQETLELGVVTLPHRWIE
jgi:lipopolysaccharide transport system ATP-binding protein